MKSKQIPLPRIACRCEQKTALSPCLISISNFYLLITNHNSLETISRLYYYSITQFSRQPITENCQPYLASIHLDKHRATQPPIDNTRLTNHFSLETISRLYYYSITQFSRQPITENCQPYVASIHLDKHRATQPPINNTRLTNHDSLFTDNRQLKTVI